MRIKKLAKNVKKVLTKTKNKSRIVLNLSKKKAIVMNKIIIKDREVKNDRQNRRRKKPHE